MIQRVRFYFFSLCSIILGWAGFIEFFDTGTRIIAGLLGIALTCYLIVKARHDITKVKLDNQMKKLEIQEKEQKLYQLMEHSKKLGK